MDQCQEIGRQLRFKFHQSVPDGASLADDCFTRWLRDNESVNIDWSNFGAHHDA